MAKLESGRALDLVTLFSKHGFCVAPQSSRRKRRNNLAGVPADELVIGVHYELHCVQGGYYYGEGVSQS